jgi:transcriptional regulator with XRE-family HTH domain
MLGYAVEMIYFQKKEADVEEDVGEIRFSKERLNALIQKRGMSASKLAKKTGISRTMISYLRAGKRTSTSAENITKLASALGTTVDYLVGKDDSGPPESIRRLTEVVGDLSEERREELTGIAALLNELDQKRQAEIETDYLLYALASVQRAFGEDVRKEFEQLIVRRGISIHSAS